MSHKVISNISYNVSEAVNALLILFELWNDGEISKQFYKTELENIIRNIRSN